MAKLVARLPTTAALGSNPDIFQKYKMGDISKGIKPAIIIFKKEV